MKNLFLASAFLLVGVTASAQLQGSVSVEGEYEPLFIETERLNSFPLGYKFELPATTLNYEMQGIVTDFRPDLLTMGVTGRRTEWPGKRKRGYLNLRLGSYLNSSLKAGYYAVTDSLNTLLADVDFRSSSLYKIHDVPSSYSQPERKSLYDGKIGLHFSRLCGREGLLNASVSYRAAYFNYYGTSLPLSLLQADGDGFHVPTQSLNQGHVSLNYSSSPSIVRGWHAEADVYITAFRRFYTRSLTDDGQVVFNGFPGARETELNLGGGYAFGLTSNSAVALDASSAFLFYPSANRQSEVLSAGRRNYGIISLTPSYRFEKENLSLKAGVNLDFSYDAMGTAPEKDFAPFHASPDVELDFRIPEGFGVHLGATGGVTPSTLRQRESFDRYMIPELLSTLPVYSPIDANIGLSAGPFAGFDASLGFRYAVSRNVPVGGWYQAYLGSYTAAAFPPGVESILDPYFQALNLRGMSASLQLNYSYGDLAGASFAGTFTPQNGEKGIFNGFDRPRWIIEARAFCSPIRKLKIEAEYIYRGVRNCYGIFKSQNGDGRVAAFRLPDLALLNLCVSYSIFDNFDIYCRADNILNQHKMLLPGLPAEGMVVSGGINIVF